MRIIAGEKRGLRLASLEGLATRPTKDRVREAIFSALQGYLSGSLVLDLFAGTGAMGLEALSRGANYVDFVEWNKGAQKTLKDNIKRCQYENHCQVSPKDALLYLDSVKKSYDLIFLDPPYEAGYYEKVLEKISQRKLLKDEGVVVVEHKKNSLFLEENRLFLIHKEKVYGTSAVTYLKSNRRLDDGYQ